MLPVLAAFALIVTDKQGVLPANATLVPAVISNYFPKLSRDFVNVEERAESIAKRQVNKTTFWQIVVPIIGAAMIAAIPLFQLMISKPWEKELSRLSSKIESLEKTTNQEGRLRVLEDVVSKLEGKKGDERPR